MSLVRPAIITTLLFLATACANKEPAVPVEQMRAMPDIVGGTVADAAASIEDVGLVATVVPEGGTEDAAVPVASCPDGKVTGQAPRAGDEVRAASTVVLFASGC